MVRPVDVPPTIQATSASVPMRHFLPPLVLHQPGFSCRWGGLGKGDGTGPDIRSLLARSGEVPAGRVGADTYSPDGKPLWRARVFGTYLAGTPVAGMTVERRSLPAVPPHEIERPLRERLDALGPAPRAELLHVLMLPDFERADRIGEF